MDASDDEIRTAAQILPAIAPICKTMMNNRMRMKTVERKKDAELEVVEAKQRVSSRSRMPPTPDAPPAESQVERQPDDVFEESIEEMISDEECELCARLLDGLKRIDADKRAIALSEYGRFKQSVDDTEDVSAIRDTVEDMTVLRDVMMKEFNMIG